MSALCRAYTDIADAERAVQALLAGGVPDDDVRLLMGAEVHDARREEQGGFARAVASADRVGAFAGEGRGRDAGRGSFAGEEQAGGEGVFGNADRDVVVTWSDGRERGRVAGHHRLRRLLVDAGLDEATADADVHALHDGRVLVLVTTAGLAPEHLAALADAG
jgi:hypothetical protein